jgi:hypothetical protein
MFALKEGEVLQRDYMTICRPGWNPEPSFVIVLPPVLVKLLLTGCLCCGVVADL